MPNPIRNRIKGHRRVRACELVPHEFNFRLHPEGQRAALEALYNEVGFARSLLAYELPDGRLKLIDGHLRRDLDADMEQAPSDLWKWILPMVERQLLQMAKSVQIAKL